jgi:amino acid transporter
LSSLLAKVDENHKTPAPAIWALATFALILAFSINIYSAVVSIATIALYISYGLPIATRLWVRLNRKHEKIGPWNLGRFSTLNSILAVLWVAFITVVFMLPPNEQAAQVMGIFVVILVLLWFFYVRNKYLGPKYHEN